MCDFILRFKLAMDVMFGFKMVISGVQVAVYALSVFSCDCGGSD